MKNQNTEHWIQTVIFFRLNWHHRLLKGSPNNFAQAKIALVSCLLLFQAFPIEPEPHFSIFDFPSSSHKLINQTIVKANTNTIMMQRTSHRHLTIQSLLNGQSPCLEENGFKARAEIIDFPAYMDDTESSTTCSSEEIALREECPSTQSSSQELFSNSSSRRRRRAATNCVLVGAIRERAADLAVAAIGSDYTHASTSTSSKKESLKHLHTGFSKRDSLLADAATAGLRLKHMSI